MKFSPASTPARKNFRRNHFFPQSNWQLRVVLAALLFALPLPLIETARTGTAASTASAPPQQPESPARLSDVISVRAPERSGAAAVKLKDGRDVLADYEGDGALVQALGGNSARPLALAAADFDEDGTPDLVSGYASGASDGGIITIHRGDVDAIYPNAPEARRRGQNDGDADVAPFLSPARVFGLKAAAPDFLGAGDFNADGHWDVVAASRGGRALSVLAGDGRGNLAAIAQEIALPGAVTALATGEINRADGLADVVVGVGGKDGAQVLVFESPQGALKAQPEIFPMPAPVTALAVGQLDSSYAIDLAAAAGHELVIVRGRDRKLSITTAEEQIKLRPARVERRAFASAIASLVIGEFDGQPQSDIALLTKNGAVQVLSRGSSTAARKGGRKQATEQGIAEWQSRVVSSEQSSAAAQLVAARVSTRGGDDLLLLETAERRVRVLPEAQGKKRSIFSELLEEEAGRDAVSLTIEAGGPVAMLPMQLNVDALTDLVVLRQNESAPAVILTAQNAHRAAVSESVTQSSILPSLLSNGVWRGAVSAGSLPQKSPTQAGAKAAAPKPTPRAKTSGKGSQTIRPLESGCPMAQISVGQTVNGTLATTDCFLDDGSYVDFYTFTGTAGQQVAITMESLDFDTYLYLVAPDGSLLADDDDSGGGTDSQIPSAGGFISLPANGTYTIYATSFDEEETGAYSLSLTGPGGGGQCPATPISSGQNLTGALDTTDCFFNSGPRNGAFVDVYTFAGSAGQQAVVAMVSNSFDTFLYLLAPDGSQLAEDDDGGGGTNSRIPPTGTLTLSANGVYTIHATSFSPQTTGSYVIGISLVNPPPASTVVTNVNDSGPGSLRQALLNANANQGVDTISFQIGTGARTISPASALPEITDPVVIDGTTQPGFNGTPLIELNGQSAPQGTGGLRIIAGSSRVRGLVINGFGAADCNAGFDVDLSVGSGLILSSRGNNIIEGNYLGTNLSGTSALCNSGNGVYLFNSSNNTIGGTTAAARNLISGNRLPGLAIGGEFSAGNLVQGNYVGTDATGNADLGNRSNGMIVINGTGHVIGGTAPGARNLVSGNDSPGVALGFSDPAGILVQGNYIGTNAAGSAALPNLGGGVIVGGFFQLNGEPITATDNTIGGTTPAARNVISGNTRVPGDTNLDSGNGVEIINTGSQDNLVQGNYIGLNAAGNAALPNSGSGVFITRAPNNFIGGVLGEVEGTTNYIAGNGRYGVGVGIRRSNNDNSSQFITGGDSIDIVFNVIGTDPTQTLRLGNALDGVYVDADSVDIYVNQNVIAFNGRSGVRIPDSDGINGNPDNSGRSVNLDLNFIFSNRDFGIDLGLPGIEPNDVGDGDEGANLQQNFPELRTQQTIAGSQDAQRSGKTPDPKAAVSTNWTLRSRPNTTYTIHWYLTNDAQCTSMNTQLMSRPLLTGRPVVTTDANGERPFVIDFDFPEGVSSGVMSCTATPVDGNHTSPYSECMRVSATTNAPTVQFAASTATFSESESRATLTLTRSGDASAALSVAYATVDNPAAVPCSPQLTPERGISYARCDYATSIDTVTFAAGDSQPKQITIPLIDDAHVEGAETFQVLLSQPSAGASLGALSSATVTITDNDTNPNVPNPIFSTPLFVRQQYLDFLSREPEAGEPWSAILNNCPDPLAGPEVQSACDRILVSQSFFGSPEFRLKGFYVFTFYRVAFPERFAEYTEIVADMSAVTGRDTPDLHRKRALFPVTFTGRQEFRQRYDALSEPAFVNVFMERYNLQQIRTPDPLNPEALTNPNDPDSRVKVTLTRAELVNRLTTQAFSRSQALRAIVESDEVRAAEFNRTFVAIQYYGYLRRTPEPVGYQAWLDTLARGESPRVMVNGFMNSPEYQLRFGRIER